jgi:hypothetical protein
MAMEDGYAAVGPVTPEVAQALLGIAESQGLSPDAIRTSIGGFIVPVDVAKRYEETLGAAPEEESEVPDETWKNADIKAWAEAHEVDLGEATKKADMIAAINATDKE